jgi:hypothetical protein
MVYISDGSAQFDGSDRKGNTNSLTFENSKGLVVYSAQSDHDLLDYCGLRNQSGTPIPQFDSCVSDPAKNGLDCVVQNCQKNAEENGIVCTGSNPFFVPYSQSFGMVGLSQSDDTTIRAECNISFQNENSFKWISHRTHTMPHAPGATKD